MTRPTILDMDLVVVLREATDEMQFSGNANVYDAMLSASPYPTEWDDVRKYVEGLETLASKVNGIRNSIIGCQKINWSEHIYPLVAALEEAGIEGAGYPEARANVGTLIERTIAAEDRAEAAEARIAELEKEKHAALTMIAMLEKRLSKADVVVDLAEEYIIDGITTAKEQYEMNAPYPAREPGYRAALDDARAAHAAARAYMEGK